MFTTGSKFFFGATALSVAGAVVFAATTGGPTGIMGTVGLLTLASVFTFLAGINYYNRDGNVPGLQQDAQFTAAAAQPPVGRSMWPLVTAVGFGGLAVGAVSTPVVFKVSLVVLLAAAAEWMVQGWSERASSDAQYNASVRRRMLYPLEFPILGALVLGVVVYSFSRILLHISKDAGLYVFIVLGALVLFAGFLFAGKRKVGKSTIVGVCAVAAVALLGAGVASAVQGQRTIEHHATTESDPAVCLESGVDDHIDEEASQAVSLKSNVVANVYSRANGDLVAFVTGYPNIEYHQVPVPRSATVGVIFHNQSDEPQRLTARLGTFGDAAEVVRCTTAVENGGQGFLEMKIDKSNAHSSTPMVLQIGGSDEPVIEILVP